MSGDQMLFDNVLGDGWIKVGANAPATSRQAARTAALNAGTQAHRVLKAISEAGERGCTDYELADQLGLDGNSIRPRRISLKERGLIDTTGNDFRTNAHGNLCAIWTITPAGAQALRWAK